MPARRHIWHHRFLAFARVGGGITDAELQVLTYELITWRTQAPNRRRGAALNRCLCVAGLLCAAIGWSHIGSATTSSGGREARASTLASWLTNCTCGFRQSSTRPIVPELYTGSC